MSDDSELEQREEAARAERLTGRRDFLKGLRKWSAAVIGGAVLGHLVTRDASAGGWINRRGGWVNGAVGGGGSWVNRGGGGWINGRGGGGGWINR